MKIQDLDDSFEKRIIPGHDNEKNLYDLDINVDWIELDEQNQTAITLPQICSGGCIRTNNENCTSKCKTQTCKNCKILDL